MINILYQDYHSMSTISCFISFTLLVQMKLYNSLSIAYKSVKNDTMLSAFLTEFVSFNVLDKDYIKDTNNPQKDLKIIQLKYLIWKERVFLNQ